MPARIEETGPASYQCNQCSGALLSLAPYLDWVKGARTSDMAAAEAVSFEGADASDTKRALPCPKCSRIMLRFNVLADKAHGLDFCFHCEEVWLDAGEWQYLKAHGLHTRITSISTDPYQRRLRDQAVRESALQRFRATIGDEEFNEVEKFATWLKKQPTREAILRHLNSEVRESGRPS
ncbi:TFIIB-type zinc ribbon-containing protein [Diaphorobacter aerolatus]|uniref:Zf-TFIIB domain-containing protein n=1 Tax=Diaphorobacter aerolatus TaxID=1288495 RepID=A0A7H0GME3_9BURK|nr:zf-TFIIB domain-containing protein [Diaphorobacter aerolatus]QNP49459.1 zf-TFIIB domain-containing protein [Diaphorobacter aerolatus]